MRGKQCHHRYMYQMISNCRSITTFAVSITVDANTQHMQHHFPIRGHSFLTNDRDFGQSEGKKKCIKSIYIPDQWYYVILIIVFSSALAWRSYLTCWDSFPLFGDTYMYASPLACFDLVCFLILFLRCAGVALLPFLELSPPATATAANSTLSQPHRCKFRSPEDEWLEDADVNWVVE